jgi:hypothetical protein
MHKTVLVTAGGNDISNSKRNHDSLAIAVPVDWSLNVTQKDGRYSDSQEMHVSYCEIVRATSI